MAMGGDEKGGADKNKIFVGGLAQETSKETLLEYFQQWGNIVDAVVMYDNNTRRSRGFGFVTFEDAESVNAVMDKSPHVIDRKEVECKKACPRDTTGRSNASGGHMGGPEHGGTGMGGAHNSTRTDKIFVGGLPDLSEEEFRTYFEEFGQVQDAVLMFDRNSHRPRGFGFVTFDNSEVVDKVISLYRQHHLKGKWVEVKRAQPRENEPKGGGMMAGRGDVDMRDFGYGDGGGYAPMNAPVDPAYQQHQALQSPDPWSHNMPVDPTYQQMPNTYSQHVPQQRMGYGAQSHSMQPHSSGGGQNGGGGGGYDQMYGYQQGQRMGQPQPAQHGYGSGYGYGGQTQGHDSLHFTPPNSQPLSSNGTQQVYHMGTGMYSQQQQYPPPQQHMGNPHMTPSGYAGGGGGGNGQGGGGGMGPGRGPSGYSPPHSREASGMAGGGVMGGDQGYGVMGGGYGSTAGGYGGGMSMGGQLDSLPPHQQPMSVGQQGQMMGSSSGVNQQYFHMSDQPGVQGGIR